MNRTKLQPECLEIFVRDNGHMETIYDERLNGRRLGGVQIQRASFVEPDQFGHWYADLGPVGGPRFGPFEKRSSAICAEVDWLKTVYLQE